MYAEGQRSILVDEAELSLFHDTIVLYFSQSSVECKAFPAPEGFAEVYNHYQRLLLTPLYHRDNLKSMIEGTFGAAGKNSGSHEGLDRMLKDLENMEELERKVMRMQNLDPNDPASSMKVCLP
jgi:hypothetical protein